MFDSDNDKSLGNKKIETQDAQKSKPTMFDTKNTSPEKSNGTKKTKQGGSSMFDTESADKGIADKTRNGVSMFDDSTKMADKDPSEKKSTANQGAQNKLNWRRSLLICEKGFKLEKFKRRMQKERIALLGHGNELAKTLTWAKRIYVYPIKPEDLSSPLVLEAMGKCYQSNFRFHRVTKGESLPEVSVLGSLNLAFIKQSDCDEMAIRFRDFGTDLKIHDPYTEASLASYVDDFEKKVAAGMDGPLPIQPENLLYSHHLDDTVTEDNLWEIFPYARRMFIGKERESYVEFQSEKLLNQNLEWLDGNPPRQALRNKNINFFLYSKLKERALTDEEFELFLKGKFFDLSEKKPIKPLMKLTPKPTPKSTIVIDLTEEDTDKPPPTNKKKPSKVETRKKSGNKEQQNKPRNSSSKGKQSSSSRGKSPDRRSTNQGRNSRSQERRRSPDDRRKRGPDDWRKRSPDVKRRKSDHSPRGHENQRQHIQDSWHARSIRDERNKNPRQMQPEPLLSRHYSPSDDLVDSLSKVLATPEGQENIDLLSRLLVEEVKKGDDIDYEQLDRMLTMVEEKRLAHYDQRGRSGHVLAPRSRASNFEGQQLPSSMEIAQLMLQQNTDNPQELAEFLKLAEMLSVQGTLESDARNKLAEPPVEEDLGPPKPGLLGDYPTELQGNEWEDDLSREQWGERRKVLLPDPVLAEPSYEQYHKSEPRDDRQFPQHERDHEQDPRFSQHLRDPEYDNQMEIPRQDEWVREGYRSAHSPPSHRDMARSRHPDDDNLRDPPRPRIIEYDEPRTEQREPRYDSRDPTYDDLRIRPGDPSYDDAVDRRYGDPQRRPLIPRDPAHDTRSGHVESVDPVYDDSRRGTDAPRKGHEESWRVPDEFRREHSSEHRQAIHREFQNSQTSSTRDDRQMSFESRQQEFPDQSDRRGSERKDGVESERRIDRDRLESREPDAPRKTPLLPVPPRIVEQERSARRPDPEQDWRRHDRDYSRSPGAASRASRASERPDGRASKEKVDMGLSEAVSTLTKANVDGIDPALAKSIRVISQMVKATKSMGENKAETEDRNRENSSSRPRDRHHDRSRGGSRDRSQDRHSKDTFQNAHRHENRERSRQDSDWKSRSDHHSTQRRSENIQETRQRVEDPYISSRERSSDRSSHGRRPGSAEHSHQGTTKEVEDYRPVRYGEPEETYSHKSRSRDPTPTQNVWSSSHHDDFSRHTRDRDYETGRYNEADRSSAAQMPSERVDSLIPQDMDLDPPEPESVPVIAEPHVYRTSAYDSLGFSDEQMRDMRVMEHERAASQTQRDYRHRAFDSLGYGDGY